MLYRETVTVGEAPLTPEEVASEYNVPMDAVLEAIDYCATHQDLLDAERAGEQQRIAVACRDKWPYAPRDFRPDE